VEINYSLIDTIESYDKLFSEFCSESLEYENLNKNYRLIYLASGLGLSNSIHEKFIKSIIYQYSGLYQLSSNQQKKLIRNYKSPKRIEEFVSLFNLDLEEAFNINKPSIINYFGIIESVNNLISVLNQQRDIRNDYLHGDFNFEDDISFDQFKENIIYFQKIHNIVLRITKYSFTAKLNELPDIRGTL